MDTQQFSWQVEVLPRHIHPVIFSVVCLMLGGAAAYCFSVDNIFACALFLVCIAIFTLEECIKKEHIAEGMLGSKSVILDSKEYKHKDLSHFSVLDENTLLLYKKGEGGRKITMHIRNSDFDAMYNFFSAFLDEKEYEPDFLEAVGNILSP